MERNCRLSREFHLPVCLFPVPILYMSSQPPSPPAHKLPANSSTPSKKQKNNDQAKLARLVRLLGIVVIKPRRADRSLRCCPFVGDCPWFPVLHPPLDPRHYVHIKKCIACVASYQKNRHLSIPRARREPAVAADVLSPWGVDGAYEVFLPLGSSCFEAVDSSWPSTYGCLMVRHHMSR